MDVTVTITKAGRCDSYGRPLAVGATVTLDAWLAGSLVQAGFAVASSAFDPSLPASTLSTASAALAAATPYAGRKLALVGDSITASISGAPLTGNFAGITESLIGSNGGLSGGLCTTCVAFLGAQRSAPAGAGTLTYNKAANTITWAAFGDTPGPAVVVDRTKAVLLQSGTLPLAGIWVFLRPNGGGSMPTADTVDTTVIVGSSGAGYQPNVQCFTECYADWMKPLLGSGYRVIGKWASSGNRLRNVLDMLPDIIAAAPDEVLLMIGTNDVAAGRTYAQITADLTTVYATLLGAGIRVTTPGILPRGDSDLGAAIRALNQFASAYGQDNKLFKFVDVYSTMLLTPLVYLTAQPFGVDTTLFNTTGANYLHPNRKGSYLLASAIASQMRGVAPARFEDAKDLYVASTAPYGNLVTNPQMIVGSSRAGTAAGQNVNGNTTGTPPDDWVAWATGTATGISSIVTRASVDASDTTPGNYWKMAITAGTGLVRMYTPLTLANFLPGDLVEMWMDVAVDVPANLTRFDACVEFNGADRISFGQNTADTLSAETTLRRFTIATPRFQVPPQWSWNSLGGNPSLVRLYVNLGATGANVNVHIANVSVRKVPQ